MDIETLTAVIGWASLINIGVLLIWWLALTFAKEWMFNMHRRWFSLTDAQLNELLAKMASWFVSGKIESFATAEDAMNWLNLDD